eukprot:gene105-biopygen8131
MESPNAAAGPPKGDASKMGGRGGCRPGLCRHSPERHRAGQPPARAGLPSMLSAGRGGGMLSRKRSLEGGKLARSGHARGRLRRRLGMKLGGPQKKNWRGLGTPGGLRDFKDVVWQHAASFFPKTSFGHIWRRRSTPWAPHYADRRHRPSRPSTASDVLGNWPGAAECDLERNRTAWKVSSGKLERWAAQALRACDVLRRRTWGHADRAARLAGFWIPGFKGLTPETPHCEWAGALPRRRRPPPHACAAGRARVRRAAVLLGGRAGPAPVFQRPVKIPGLVFIPGREVRIDGYTLKSGQDTGPGPRQIYAPGPPVFIPGPAKCQRLAAGVRQLFFLEVDWRVGPVSPWTSYCSAPSRISGGPRRA